MNIYDAAKAVVERWDSPNWSDGTHTRDHINSLRLALSDNSKMNLFAAAPDLLDALILCREEMNRLPRSLGYDFTHIPKIDAAIAKARGEV